MNIKTHVNFDKLKFKDALGEGFFGRVYRVTDGKNYDDRFVAKVFQSPKALAIVNKVLYDVSFGGETTALKELGSKNVSPKIYFEKNTFSKRYYVMEAMNETLNDIFRHDYFTRSHLNKLTKLLQRLFKTQYRHADLHVNNVMWNDRLNDFRIVDWGMYNIDTKDNATNGIKRMIRSGDMFYLVQLYVAYRIDIDGEEYWKTSFDNFLTLVPKDYILSEKYTPEQIKRRIDIDIIDYLNTGAANTPKRSRLKSKKSTTRLRLQEAQKLLGEKSNNTVVEMQNVSRSLIRNSSSKKRSKKSNSVKPSTSN